MSRPDDAEDNWKQILDGLCTNLNVDPVAAKKSKDSFLEIKRNYTLDVSVVMDFSYKHLLQSIIIILETSVSKTSSFRVIVNTGSTTNIW
jgi:hypothetical protein